MKQVNTIEEEGVITEVLPNTLFKVELGSGKIVLASVAGRLRRAFLRMLPGEKVKVEMTPYDDKRGRIVFRYR